MIIITDLSGTAKPGEVQERRGILNCLHLEPTKGFFIKMQLGASGLYVVRGNDTVVIPTDALLAIAAPHLKDLKPISSEAEAEPAS